METVSIICFIVVTMTIMYVLAHLLYWVIKKDLPDCNLSDDFTFNEDDNDGKPLYTFIQKKIFIVIYFVLMLATIGIYFYTTKNPNCLWLLVPTFFPPIVIYLLMTLLLGIYVCIGLIISLLEIFYGGIKKIFNLKKFFSIELKI